MHGQNKRSGITCTIPTSEDGFCYIPLGVLANDATTKCFFSTSNRLYAYLDGAFQPLDQAAKNIAQKALTSANEKNKNIYEPKPAVWPTTGFKEGDTWWATDEGYKMYRFNGTSWVAAPLDTDAFAAGCIKAGLIDTGAITADKINANAYTGRTFTGSTFKTASEEARSVTFSPDGKTALDNGAYVSGDVTYNILRARGLQALDGSNNVRASSIPAIDTTYAATNHERYGWYFTHYIYAARMYTANGKVLSLTDVLTQIDAALNSHTSSTTGVSGITGVVNLVTGIAMLKFASFSFAANTSTTANTYTLNSDFFPALELDLMSSHNSVRFKITTDGHIRPFTQSSSAVAIRGTFTFITLTTMSIVPITS